MQSTGQLTARIRRSSEIERTPRVVQIEGMFDIPLTKRAELTWDVKLPLGEKSWQVGLIVGPSGSGKSTILGELFGQPHRPEWPKDKAVVDGFPAEMGVRDVTAALSAVGFSSPPSWMRPYSTLSNGEQFRADLARLLAESSGLAVVDEFTSVVDRTVAKVASAAVAKHVRRSDKQLVVASCHYDVTEWLCPDWIYDTGSASFRWECLQRPPIDIELYRSTSAAWGTFHRHHYLSGDLHRAAHCFVALVEGRPAAFASAMHFPHPRTKNIWREHRTVCLPDFQGVGIGNAVSETVASAYRARGKRYRSVTASPAMIRHRARSPQWKMDRRPSLVGASNGSVKVNATERLTASFEYVGPPASEDLADALLG